MMGYWGALWRGIRTTLGLPVEPIDYSPEAQLARLARRLADGEGR